jgi:MoxR-like ATPase
MTSYLQDKVDCIQRQLSAQVFKHVVIRGEPGSGKMSLVKVLAKEHFNSVNLRGKDLDDSIKNKFIVVTIEDTMDAKNLVGTYVCNETGEFVFKKGPLTVAAENGLWLILRNI